MEEIKNEIEVITVRKEKIEKGDTKFDSFVFNKDGVAVKLSFRQDSNDIKVIPYGISRIRVKKLSPKYNSFYPKYYATFIELANNN